jgi:hypothetical protein
LTADDREAWDWYFAYCEGFVAAKGLLPVAFARLEFDEAEMRVFVKKLEAIETAVQAVRARKPAPADPGALTMEGPDG